MTFIERYALWSDEQKEAAARALRLVEEQGSRWSASLSPTSTAAARQDADRRRDGERAAATAVSITSSLLAKDTSRHDRVPGVDAPAAASASQAFEGAGDVLMVPDPSTFRVLPWAPQDRLAAVPTSTSPTAGRCPMPRAHIYRTALSRLAAAGYDYVAGLEVEFHVFKLRDPIASRPRSRASPATPPRGQPPHARLPVSLRAALRPARAGARDHPARHRRARPAAALGRVRVRPEPVRVHVPGAAAAWSRPTPWCCSAAP